VPAHHAPLRRGSRISPIDPRIFEGQLLIVGMPNATKFRDLGRDPRFYLHTATVDPHVSDGDAKLWGDARNLQDDDLHQRFATDLFEKTGMDLRRQEVRSLLRRRSHGRLVSGDRGRPAGDHHLEAG
jgi:hypothetical protein